MEQNKDFYYEDRAQTVADVKSIFDVAVARNAKYYRAVSTSGKIYGWSGNSSVQADVGQEWFENPEYHAPEAADNSADTIQTENKQDEPVQAADKPITDEASVADELSTDVEKSQEPAETPVERDETNNEAALRARIFELKRELLGTEELLAITERELQEVKDAIKVLIAFIKSA